MCKTIFTAISLALTSFYASADDGCLFNKSLSADSIENKVVTVPVGTTYRVKENALYLGNLQSYMEGGFPEDDAKLAADADNSSYIHLACVETYDLSLPASIDNKGSKQTINGSGFEWVIQPIAGGRNNSKKFTI
ncbi:TPA: hypothetical protein I7730_15990 [Vibrio vulnificus]|uniref:Uncharacterized protein n=1 Tax=Vibrio vulnificus TaxID=672 RepID=A0A8H9TG79_VIBVL|nr:hypothetical protein [Vibrio vulnificus]